MMLDVRTILYMVVYLVLFGLSFYALMGLDWSKSLRPGQNQRLYLLLLLLALALAWLCTQALFDLTIDRGY